MDKPLIGVSVNPDQYSQPYLDAVERSGGEPWLIPYNQGFTPQEILSKVNALIFGGGEDIHPKWYGQELQPDIEMHFNEARDALEIPLVKAALDEDMPVYCICRGMQVLNVALGGSIVQDMAGHIQDGEGDERVTFHRIFIAPGSKLAAVVGSGGFVRVNSWHHQGVREAQKSPQLLASAYSLEDGVIEALESPRHRWVIGVQFHPERRLEVPPHFDRLFQSLVDRASERLHATNSR